MALINVIMIILLLLLLLLFELLSPKGWPIEASQQAWRYFKPGSQATLQYILFGWELIQMSTVGQCEQHKDVKKCQ